MVGDHHFFDARDGTWTGIRRGVRMRNCEVVVNVPLHSGIDVFIHVHLHKTVIHPSDGTDERHTHLDCESHRFAGLQDLVGIGEYDVMQLVHLFDVER